MSEFPRPLQIVSTGEEEENSFDFNEENLELILSKIPPNTKVAVLSVVGAFRTGKSFLLTFFLRYLRHGDSADLSLDWMTENPNMDGVKDNMSNNEGFVWQGGQERQTTGIWMWSEPFIHKVSGCPENIAIVLMDTQGMFDNEATMSLTARIFGLSTLVSSFQVYNIDKRIQEDNLQHLALFSEYGRMALDGSEEEEAKKLLSSKDESVAIDENDIALEEKTPNKNKKTVKAIKSKSLKARPFQRIDFLVRDWQNFDVDWEDAVNDVKLSHPIESPEGIAEMRRAEDEIYSNFRKDMCSYLENVIRSRKAEDLQSTRDQISKCYDKVGCFLLPHPGAPVTKKNYDGDLTKIDESFKALLDRYVRYVFDKAIEPKVINGRQITGQELFQFMKVYTQMFASGESSFPKAMTMLEATAEANNRNAYDLGMQYYTTTMDEMAGPSAQYVKDSELRTHERNCELESLVIFDNIATMGPDAAIQVKRDKLQEDVGNLRVRYLEANSNRNPFKNVEFVFLPLICAIISWIAAKVIDSTCSTDFCEVAEAGFVNIYLFTFFGILVYFYKHVSGSLVYLKEVLPLLVQGRLPVGLVPTKEKKNN